MKDDRVDEEDDLPRVTDAEITEDGALVVKFDRYVVKGKKKAVFMPEALFALVEEYGEIETEGDFAGLPCVSEESVFDEEEEEEPADPLGDISENPLGDDLGPDVKETDNVEGENEP
jgi:hypothetical protein